MLSLRLFLNMPPKGESLLAPTRSPTHQKELGFNLAELLVVLLLIGLLFGIAWPAGQRLLDQGRLRAATNEAYAALLYTRNEATRRRQTHALCLIANRNTSIANCSLSAGSLLGVYRVADGQLVHAFELTPQAAFTFQNTPGTNDRLEFQPLGNRAAGNDVFLEVQVGDAANTRRVEVCFNGRVVIRPHLNQSECD